MTGLNKFYLRLILITYVISFSAFAESLSYSGRLVNNNGSPVIGPVNLKFELASTADTSTILCSEQVTGVALTNGVFHVKLDLNCGGNSLSQILASIPNPNSAAIRVTNESANPDRVYSFQSLHAVPQSNLSEVSKQLVQMGAANNEVLTWTGTKWEPKAVAPASGGTLTSITANSGLSGGMITTTGTIGIAASGVTDSHLAGNISRSKITNGTANYVVVNDGAGALSQIAQLSLTQGGTGSNTAAGARTNLGLGTAAVASIGYGAGQVMPGDEVPICLAHQKLQMNLGPTFWSCANDNDSLDATKLPLAGGTMTGAIDMSNKAITNVMNPVDPADAANKAYVDSKVGGASQWITTGSDIYYNTGKVGIGLSILAPDMSLQIESVKTDASGRGVNIDLKHHAATSGNYSILGAANKAQQTIAGGVTNSGQITGSWNVAVRNNIAGSVDAGNLALLRGEFLQYGHRIAEPTGTPVTTDAYGLYLSPNYQSGTITNMYDIYVHPGAAGGIVTNYYGLYLAGSQKKNYIEGNLGIGVVTATEKLHVGGNQNLDGKLRLKSDNANYVEVKAPAGLAATLTFNLPGSIGVSGQALITDGSGNLSWETVATGASAVGGDLTGTVTNAQIAAGAIVDADISASAGIAQSKISGLTTSLSGKEGTITAGTTAQYWRGDKTWQTLNTTAVVEGTNLYFTEPRVLGTDLAGYTATTGTITVADTVLSAIEKLSGNLAATSLAQSNFVLKAGDTMSGALAMGNNKITGLATPTVGTDAATMAYVDSKVSSAPGDNLGNHTATTNLAMGSNNITGVNKISLADGAWNSPSYNFTSSPSTGFFYGSGLGASVNGSLVLNLSTSVFQLNGSYAPYMRLGGGTNNATAPTYSFGGDTDTGMFNLSTNILGFTTGGVEKMRILSTGEVAIGKTTAAGLLDVAGNVALDGSLRLKSDNTNYVELKAPSTLAATTTYTFPATAGTSGYALTTNGAGVLSWSPVATTASTVGGDISGTIANAQIVADAVGTAEIANTSVTYAKLNLTDGDIPQAKVNGLVTALAGKEATITAGTTAQYWRGDKTWQALTTSVVPEGTNLYFTQPRVMASVMSGYGVGTAIPVNATDTLSQAIGKLEAQIVANDAAFDSSGVWSKNGTAVYYNNSVGIGTNLPTAPLEVNGDIISTGGSTALSLKATATDDHTYMSFFARSAAPTTRTAYFGYPSPASTQLNIMNEISTGSVIIGTDGTERFRIDPTGNIGIGNSAPSRPLTIGNGTSGDKLLSLTEKNTAGNRRASMLAGWWEVGQDSATNGNRDFFIFDSIAAAHRLLIDTTGRVGIGTTVPTAGLEIAKYTPWTTVSWNKHLKFTGGGNSSIEFDVASNMKWGVGATSSGNSFHIFSNTASDSSGVPQYHITTLSNGFVGIGSGAPVYRLDVLGTIRGYGITDSSDLRLKNSVASRSQEEDLNNILKLRSVSYKWNDQTIDKDKQIGFIAQEMEKVFPDLVKTDKNGMKSVNYSHLVSPIANAIKELYQKITGQEAEVKNLKREIASVKNEKDKEIAALKQQNAEMKARLDRIEKQLARQK